MNDKNKPTRSYTEPGKESEQLSHKYQTEKKETQAVDCGDIICGRWGSSVVQCLLKVASTCVCTVTQNLRRGSHAAVPWPLRPSSRSMVGAPAAARTAPSRALVVLSSLKERQQYGLEAKVPVTKAADLNSIPAPRWWKERTDSHKLSSDHDICAAVSYAQACTHKHTINKWNAFLKSKYSNPNSRTQ